MHNLCKDLQNVTQQNYVCNFNENRKEIIRLFDGI